MLWALLVLYCLYCSIGGAFIALFVRLMCCLFCCFCDGNSEPLVSRICARFSPFASPKHLFGTTRTSWKVELMRFVCRIMTRIEWKCFHSNPTSWRKVLLENSWRKLCGIVCYVTPTCERFVNSILSPKMEVSISHDWKRVRKWFLMIIYIE